MTLHDGWTYEAPTAGQSYWFANVYEMNEPYVAIEQGQLADGYVRSTYAIPSAERIAAMERAVEALRDAVESVGSSRKGYCGAHHVYSAQVGEAQLDCWRAALAAVEAAK